jgi:hypothetical protein
MKRNFRCVSLLAALLSLALFTSEPRAQMPQNNSAVPYKSITPGVDSTIERTDIRVMVHISQARSDIHHKELPSARRELAEAVRLISAKVAREQPGRAGGPQDNGRG